MSSADVGQVVAPGHGRPMHRPEDIPMGREAWRSVLVQDIVLKLGDTAIDYPPMQVPASFNLTAVKAKIQAAIKNRERSVGRT